MNVMDKLNEQYYLNTVEALKQELEFGINGDKLAELLAALTSRIVKENGQLEESNLQLEEVENGIIHHLRNGLYIDIPVIAIGVDVINDILRNQREWFSYLVDTEAEIKAMKESHLNTALENIKMFSVN